MKIFRIIYLVLFSVLAGYTQGIKITMNARPNPANINSQIVLQITVSGNSNKLPDISAPNLENFKIIGGPSTSTSIQMINFKTSVQKSFTWYLLPKKTGTFKIPAVSANWKGKTYTGNPLQIAVLPAGQSTGKGSENKTAFLRASLDKTTAYPNEQVNLTYKLYVRTRAETYDIIDAPDLKAFWTENYPASGQGYQEIVDGVRYTVFELEKKALFPLQSGDISISPLRIKAILIERSRRRSNDPFDIFDDMSIFGGRRKEVVLASNPLKLRVKKLPAEPRGFIPGLVGNIKLTVNNSHFKTKTNEAITLKLTFEGNAYLKAVKAPVIDFPPEFEVYEPKINENYNLNGNEYFGRKTFEYIIIPRKEGTYHIQPTTLYSFNPQKRKYNVLQVPLLNFVIEKNTRKVYANTFNENAGITLDEDIRFIREKTTLFPIAERVFWKSRLFIILSLMQAVMWIFFAVYYNRLKKFTSDQAYFRQKTAGRMLKKRLSKASAALKEQNWELFLDELNKALTGFVGDRCMQKSAGLTSEEALEILSGKKIPPDVIEQVRSIFQDIDFSRYAPVENKTDKMKSLLDEAGKAIMALQKYV